MATLEQRLGVRLLVRTTRRLSLTEEGADFYQSCVRVLAELDEAEARAASRRREVAGTLRISLPVSFGRRWVVPHLLEMTKRHPLLRLDIRLSDRAVDLLEEGIDMVVRLGEPGNSAFLSSRCLGHQRMVTCASPAYIAERGSPACAADLAAHDCLTFAAEGGIVPWTLPGETACTTTVVIDGRHTISDGEALRMAAIDGLGISQLPTWLVADALGSGALIAVLAPQGVPGTPIQAMWPTTRDLAPKIRATVDELLAHFLPLAPGIGLHKPTGRPLLPLPAHSHERRCGYRMIQNIHRYCVHSQSRLILGLPSLSWLRLTGRGGPASAHQTTR